MSEVQHTPEPWATAYRERRDGQWAQEIFDETGELIATLAWYSIKEGSSTHTNREQNARRIVACVNACRGTTTNGLEDGPTYSDLWNEIQSIRKSVDDDGTHGGPSVLVDEALEAKTDALRERDEARALVAEFTEALLMLQKHTAKICDAIGPYQYLNGTSIVSDTYEVLAQLDTPNVKAAILRV